MVQKEDKGTATFPRSTSGVAGMLNGSVAARQQQSQHYTLPSYNLTNLRSGIEGAEDPGPAALP
jgi:hypothetical protein